MTVGPGCAGERYLLLSPDNHLREVYNDMAAHYMMAAGWVEVTGQPGFEDDMARIRNEGATLK